MVDVGYPGRLVVVLAEPVHLERLGVVVVVARDDEPRAVRTTGPVFPAAYAAWLTGQSPGSQRVLDGLARRRLLRVLLGVGPGCAPVRCVALQRVLRRHPGPPLLGCHGV